MILAGHAWLQRHKEIVNALNIFPVPDGDTGSNMVMTLRAACQEIENSTETEVGRMVQAAAQGALMGARGNSGVIFSQILRGMAHALRQKSVASAHDLALALRQGSDTAYKGVVKPVEGTILTVIRAAAEAAQHAVAVENDLDFIVSHVVQAAGEAVERTPHLLPVLARAGVVDSGGKGLFYILEGMYQGLRGEAAPALEAPAASEAAQHQAVALDPFNLPRVRYGFDVQFLIWGTALNVDAIRGWMIENGDFALVEGTPTLVKVHVHVFDPSAPLAYGLQQGFLTDVVVENMDAMAAAGQVPDDVKDELSTAEPLAEALGPLGVVAVSPGPGLSKVFSSLGAGRVVSGGQTMNPSIQELVDAVEALPNDDVILLPNNSNVLMAAQAAAQEAGRRGKRVVVVPSRTVPQGITALAVAFSQEASLEDNVRAMTGALGMVTTGEVTTAVREAHVDGIDVRVGDTIGLLDDVLTVRAADPQQAVLDLLRQMQAEDAGLITLYFGQPVSAAEAAAVRAEVEAAYQGQEVEMIDGGQPHYHYILSTEE